MAALRPGSPPTTLTSLGLSAFGQSLVDDANAAAGRATLGAPAATAVMLLDGSQAMAADLDAGGNQLSNLGAPAASSDAATKSYVDSVAAGLSPKASVRVRAQGNVTIAAPGSTVDGVTMSSGQRFLADQQSTGSQDGIYVWAGAATPATRATDLAAGASAAGTFVFVEEGTDADKGFVCTTDVGSDVVGTNGLAFAQFSTLGMTAYIQTLLDDANAAAARATLAVQDSARYIPLAGYLRVDATMGTLVVGGSPEAYDAAAHAITGRTQTWTLLVAASVTSGQTATVELYDLTASAVAATITVTATSAANVQTAAITLPGTARVYELRVSVTGSTTSHYVALRSAAIKQSWS